MTNRKYLILSFLMLLALGSCGNKGKRQTDSVGTSNDTMHIVPVSAKVEFVFNNVPSLASLDGMNDIVLLGTKDSIVYFFQNINGVRNLSLYDWSNDCVIRNLHLFKDSKRLSNMQYVNNVMFHKDSLGYYEYDSRIYNCFSYNDLVNGIVSPSSSSWMHADVYKPYKYKNKYIVVRAATKDDEKSSHMVYEPKNHMKERYDFYPEVDLSLNDPYHRRPYQVFWGAPIMNEQHGIFVHASLPSNTLTIISVDDKYKLNLEKQLNNFSPHTLSYDENALKGQLVVSYMSSQATDDYFYLAYKGKEFIEDGKSYILQYDWDGKLINVFIINGNCHSFAVTPDNSIIYIIYSEIGADNRRFVKGRIL